MLNYFFKTIIKKFIKNLVLVFIFIFFCLSIGLKFQKSKKFVR